LDTIPHTSRDRRFACSYDVPNSRPRLRCRPVAFETLASDLGGRSKENWSSYTILQSREPEGPLGCFLDERAQFQEENIFKSEAYCAGALIARNLQIIDKPGIPVCL
jgi:hypothetical protein